MKKITLLFLVFTAISFSQNTYVPDDDFEQFLIDEGYDLGPLDDYVPTANINTVYNLSIGFSSISDLTGIEDFTELRTLYCAGNGLTSLDLSSNLRLTVLNCLNNNLTSLDLSLNTDLSNFICNGNDLMSLNFKNGNNTAINNFSATGNPSLTCITVDDVNYSANNWTNIDSQTSFSVSCSTLSKSHFGLNNYISIYPNPVIDYVIVSSSIDCSFSLLNGNGQILKQGDLINGNNNIDIGQFESGLYFLHFITDSGSVLEKVIKL